MRQRPADIPIVRRFPALAAIPRAALGSFPTPVERHSVGGASLLVKRDDLSGSPVGGNKVRGLEWLLGGLTSRDRVLTVGPTGSNHALATAIHARRMGASVTVVRWRQEMNAAAQAVGRAIPRHAQVVDAGWVPAAYAIAAALRVATRARWIPAGGAATVALLGHVNAALEFSEQLGAGEYAEPERVYVPLGTGGTAAGLALGFRIAGLRARVVAVRAVPRIIGRARHVLRLADAAARLIERTTGERIARVARDDIVIEHGFYGGAYGRPLESRDTRALEGVVLDDTYSVKAFAAAAASPEHALFWLTFDGRVLQNPST